MSRHLLIDGYNLIHRISSLRPKGLTLEASRKALVRLIEEYRPQGSSCNEVTIIFDGNDAVCGGALHGATRVVFSSGQTADDLIKKMIEDSLTPHEMIVVSDDQELWQYAKAFGACYWSVAVFMAEIEKRVFKSGKVTDQENQEKNISLFLKDKIDQELKTRWLKKDHDKGEC